MGKKKKTLPLQVPTLFLKNRQTKKLSQQVNYYYLCFTEQAMEPEQVGVTPPKWKTKVGMSNFLTDYPVSTISHSQSET